MKRFYLLCLAGLLVASCEILDDDIDKHASDRAAVPLSEVAQVLANIPLGTDQMGEVFGAVSSSVDNGYDEEYMMYDLFGTPGAGVGDDRITKSKAPVLSGIPLRDMIADYVRTQAPTKSESGIDDPSEWLERLAESDIQIYWPFSEAWDGEELPVITFDPEDDSEVNIGYRIIKDSEGFRRIEEVLVDEAVAMKTPVWVVNRNTDAGYTTLEMLRREDPDWGEGGGSIIVGPGTGDNSKAACHSSSGSGGETKAAGAITSLILKDFTMNRNYDSWFTGASEFFVKVGAFEDFTATTEAELRLFTPTITDFLIVVKRNQKGIPVPFNAMVFSEWTDLVESFAFMIVEDDGGTIKDWNCTALVRVESKSYGVELKIPFHSYDDIVWRGTLGRKWFEAYSDKVCHFGDVALTFEVVKPL
jgi:hypothetical protein